MQADILDGTSLKECVRDFDLIKKVYFFNEIDSTNNKAINLLQNGLQENALLAAEYQTKGRGRFSRAWFSGKGESILFSIIVFSSQPREVWQNISFITTISLVDALKYFNISATIKWPNDVLVNNKKISGILIEIGHPKDKNKKSGIIIGIGINVNQEKFENSKNFSTEPTSVFLECHKKIERIKILEKFLFFFSDWFKEFEKGNFNLILKKYKQHSSTIGKALKLKTADVVIHGTANEIEEDGSLIVRLDSGILKKITAADIVEIDWKQKG